MSRIRTLEEEQNGYTQHKKKKKKKAKPLAAYYRSRVPGQARAPVH